MRRCGLAFACLLLAVACDRSPPPPPLVVLAPSGLSAELFRSLEGFTADTGVPIDLQQGASAANVERLIDGAGDPVDVLLTDSVVDIWRAGDEGALRPMQSGLFEAVPRNLKDPDRLWAAIERRAYRVVHRSGQPPAGTGFEALADPGLPGRFCMSSVSLPQNQALLAFLIEDLGERPAERLVRRWVRNLARAPFASQQELLAALRSGDCDVAIVVTPTDPAGLASFVPASRYVDVTAFGVGRHAAHPDAAQRFADWMLGRRQLVGAGESTPMSVGIAGWRAEEARLLAERAGYR